MTAQEMRSIILDGLDNADRKLESFRAEAGILLGQGDPSPAFQKAVAAVEASIKALYEVVIEWKPAAAEGSSAGSADAPLNPPAPASAQPEQQSAPATTAPTENAAAPVTTAPPKPFS